jgi:hypothetical protein
MNRRTIAAASMLTAVLTLAAAPADEPADEPGEGQQKYGRN